MPNNALLQLMHDTMGDLTRIRHGVDFLKGQVKLTEEEKIKMIDIIDSSEKHLRDTLDAYYINNKEK